jgi:hypothetical protein
VSSSVVMLTTTANGPMTLTLPALITYRQRVYQLIITARQKLELRACDPPEPFTSEKNRPYDSQ